MVESKDRTKITFHKGTHTIGGTLVEISFDKSRIFFDLGAVYNPHIRVKSLDDLLDHDLIAYVEGLYDPLAFNKPVKEDPTTFIHEALFISHAHLDHTSIVNFTRPSLDVYASSDTARLLRAISVEDDFVFSYTEKQKKKKDHIRKIRGLSYMESVEVGDLKVTLIPVDHDAYGACGFLIESPKAKIAYTGDIRSHGFRPYLTENFIKEVKNSDLLITEGVSYSFYDFGEDDDEELLTEDQLVDKIINLIEENPNRQISFSYYPTNLERVGEINKRIKGKRVLVLTSFSAFLVKEVLNLKTYYYKIGEKDYGLDPKFEIPLEDLLEDRGSYFFQMDARRFDLIDRLQEDSLYIHSDAEPLGDFDPAYRIFMDRFCKSKVEVREISSSGHGTTRELYKIISKINANLLAPIHSFYPERVYYKIDRLLNPSDGDTILL